MLSSARPLGNVDFQNTDAGTLWVDVGVMNNMGEAKVKADEWIKAHPERKYQWTGKYYATTT